MLSKKPITLLLKIGFFVFAIFLLYQQITNQTVAYQFDFSYLVTQVKDHWALIFFVLLMMFINWTLEAMKWSLLINKIEKVSLRFSLKAIFTGITLSAFTPNKIGEYGGRVLYLKKGNKLQGVLITFIGSMAQLLTTILFGSIAIIGLLYIFPSVSQSIEFIEFPYYVYLLIIILVNSLLLFLFLNTEIFTKMASRISFLDRYKKFTVIFSLYKKQELIKVLLFGFARYIVFSVQFFILLKVLGVDIASLYAILLIPIMFLVTSILPVWTPITDVSFKLLVSMYLFGLFSANYIGVSCATFSIWIINFILPALIGLVFLFNTKIYRT